MNNSQEVHQKKSFKIDLKTLSAVTEFFNCLNCLHREKVSP